MKEFDVVILKSTGEEGTIVHDYGLQPYLKSPGGLNRTGKINYFLVEFEQSPRKIII